MIIKSTYVLEMECDGKHTTFWGKKPPVLHIEEKTLTACRLVANKLHWRLHVGKYAGRVSCPHCARPRTGITEFPDERS